MNNEEVKQQDGGLPSRPLIGSACLDLRTTGECEAWSLSESVKMLIHAADILLYRHDYDGGKWEEILYAKKQAEKYLIEADFDL